MENGRTKDDVIDLVRRLLAFSPDNASDGEVATAVVKARELLDRYQIEMSEVEGAGSWLKEVIHGTVGGWV